MCSYLSVSEDDVIVGEHGRDAVDAVVEEVAVDVVGQVEQAGVAEQRDRR